MRQFIGCRMIWNFPVCFDPNIMSIHPFLRISPYRLILFTLL